MKVLKAAAALLLAIPFSAYAQDFDFDGVAAGTYTSLSLTSGGVTLNLSREGGTRFSISDFSGFALVQPRFGSGTLDPFVDTSASAFIADFSTGLNMFAIDMGDLFSDSDTLTVSLFSGLGGTGTLLGTQTVAYPATSGFPEIARLSLNSATPYFSAVFNGGSTGFPNSIYYDNITVAANGAVPEPASWAMMIGGIGLIGGALRRGRSKVVARVTFA